MGIWEYAQLSVTSSWAENTDWNHSTIWIWPDKTSSSESIGNTLHVCKLLNAAGSDGWELTSAVKSEVYPSNNNFWHINSIYTFKRQGSSS